MSYRLIDANALVANCKQVNDMPCIYADLPNGLDGNYYIIEQSESNRESRYSELFGTPERAARTMIDTLAACEGPKCTSSKCPFRQLQHCPDYGDYDALLEWLRGDAE